MNVREIVRKKRCQAVVIFIVYSAILFALYAKYYFDNMFPMSGDAVNFITELFYSFQSTGQGEFPLWNKWLAGGIPFLPSITPTFLLGIVPIREAIYVLYIGALSLGGTCFYLYLREINCNTYSSIAISTCYLLSIHLGGFRKSHTYIILTVAMLPVIMFLIERYFTTRKLRWLLASAVAMSIQFYIGMLQIIFYSDLFLVIYLVAFGIHYRMKINIMLLHGLAWGMSYLGLISLKLLPMLEQNVFFEQAGSAASSYEFFSSFSLSPIKLVMMIFPEFFGKGNVYQPLTTAYSSEMDIELFLGTALFFLLIAGFVLYRKEFRIKFNAVIICCTLLYAGLASFPLIGKVIYRLPVLGDFRVPARAIFIFIFLSYTVVAIALSKCEEIETRKKTIHICGILWLLLICGIAFAILTGIIVIGVTQGFTLENLSGLNGYWQTSLLTPVVCITVVVILFWIITRFAKRLERYAMPALSVVCAVSAIVQTLPFTMQTEPSSVTALTATDEVSQQLKDELGNYKIWDAFASIDGGHESIISLNRGMSKQMASINAYITFNNPYLYRLFTQDESAPMNFSGLLTGSLKAEQNLTQQNSLISMLGVRYIIDSSGILQKNPTVTQVNPPEEGTVEYQNENITVPNTQGEISVIQERFQPVPQSIYLITFNTTAQQEQPIYVDFYGGAEYDGIAQQVDFTIEPGEHTYSGVVMSEQSDLYPEIYWRVVSTSNEELVLEDFTITRLTSEELGQVYTKWDTESDPPIYINQNARDVLYIPDEIVQISDTVDLYRNAVFYDFDSVNYMKTQESRVLSPDTVTIQNIDFRNNSISANIESKTDTFVNFSQSYYPGWKAYVDGKETELHFVNGLIMGMEVPAGVHEIQFVYHPTMLPFGLVGTIGTMIILVVCYAESKTHFIRRYRQKGEKQQ